jgi:D-3-phosphoglycerate dehydrogenase
LSRIVTGPLTRALVVESPHPDLDQALAAFGIQVERLDHSPDAAELAARLAEGRHQLLFKRSRVPVDAEVVQAATDLVAIQLCCIGDDSIDKMACAEAGVLVFNDPVSNGRSVVELVAGHLIALARGLYQTYEAGRNGVWEKSSVDRWEVQGKVLGVLGLGRIGRQVARTAEALGMEVLFYDNRQVAQEVGLEMGWELAESLEALFRGSDAVTVHLSASDAGGNSNQGILSADLLLQLGEDRSGNSPRIFINLARGSLMRPEDLLAAIESRAIRRAAVDVFPFEPAGRTEEWANPYAGEPRVATTPHIGAATQEAQPRIARRVAQTAGGYARTGAIRDCVFSPRTQISMAEEMPQHTLLLVLHSTARGTKKALDDAIYEAGASNLRSQHRDFAHWGLAVDVNLLDRSLTDDQLQRIVERTTEVTGESQAVRLVRQIPG